MTENSKEILTLKAQIQDCVTLVRNEKPMVPSITNTVTINFVANAQLACGGSAAMVYLPDEGEFIAKNGGAVYLNFGTLFPIYEETIPKTAKILHEIGKNYVIDPVAIGIGALRTKLLKEIKDYKPSIIRGNASEIIALASLWELNVQSVEGPKGVDSVHSVDNAREAAILLAKYTGGAVAVSGETDLVTDGKLIAYSYGGSHFMEKITGCGCSLGGVCAVYASVANPFIAALTATQHYNLAGKKAEQKVESPAYFEREFLSQLYLSTSEEIAENKFILERVE